MTRISLAVMLAALPVAASAGSLYVQGEAQYVAESQPFAESSCADIAHCYAGHAMGTGEVGVSLGAVDLYVRHTSSVEVRDYGLNSAGVRVRQDLISW